jgi:hypothetical protein
MSGRWFRLYDELLHDPKVQMLSDELFKSLVNLWCIASKNGGVLPDIEQVAFSLRVTTVTAHETVTALFGLGFFDKTKKGLVPHNWSGRQYDNRDQGPGNARKKGDATASERMKRYRNKRNATVTEPYQDTEQRQNRTETEEEGAKPPAARGPYAYSGKVVRLNPEDHSRWKASFSFLDLNSELEARDNWLAEQPAETRRRWFGSTSKYLANRNMEAKAKAQAPPKPNPTADGFNRAFARIRAHAAATSDQEPTNVVDLSEVRRGGEGVSDPPCDVEPSNGCG